VRKALTKDSPVLKLGACPQCPEQDYQLSKERWTESDLSKSRSEIVRIETLERNAHIDVLHSTYIHLATLKAFVALSIAFNMVMLLTTFKAKSDHAHSE